MESGPGQLVGHCKGLDKRKDSWKTPTKAGRTGEKSMDSMSPTSKPDGKKQERNKRCRAGFIESYP